MNVLRENILKALGASCNRCKYDADKRILKLRTPLSRKGKGDLRYWTEVTELFEKDPRGFEVLCSNCLDIDKLERKEKSASPLPSPMLISPFGFGMDQLWAENSEVPVYFIRHTDESVYEYKHWNSPVATVEFVAAYFEVDPLSLLQADECVRLERIKK